MVEPDFPFSDFSDGRSGTCWKQRKMWVCQMVSPACAEFQAPYNEAILFTSNRPTLFGSEDVNKRWTLKRWNSWVDSLFNLLRMRWSFSGFMDRKGLHCSLNSHLVIKNPEGGPTLSSLWTWVLFLGSGFGKNTRRHPPIKQTKQISILFSYNNLIL